jgi:16S rRNA (guanine966-N2)-methyltransferase
VDLYSGSGGIGIESLSRGAKKAFFVENDKEALACIKDNLKKTRLEEKAIVIASDVKFALSSKINDKADIIFMDPPFALHAETEIIPLIIKENRLSEDGIIVVECDEKADFGYLEALGLVIFKEKQYKSCKHIFINRK